MSLYYLECLKTEGLIPVDMELSTANPTRYTPPFSPIKVPDVPIMRHRASMKHAVLPLASTTSTPRETGLPYYPYSPGVSANGHDLLWCRPHLSGLLSARLETCLFNHEWCFTLGQVRAVHEACNSFTPLALPEI